MILKKCDGPHANSIIHEHKILTMIIFSANALTLSLLHRNVDDDDDKRR